MENTVTLEMIYEFRKNTKCFNKNGTQCTFGDYSFYLLKAVF